MSGTAYQLELSAAPHLKGEGQVRSITFQLILALMPVCIYGAWLFGLSAAALILTCTVCAVASEGLANYFLGKPSSVTDGTALISGILLALTLPPGLPLWMGAVGAVVAIVPGKALFGGLGSNIFNPTLVGRAFLQASFPVAMTQWTVPLEASRFTTFIPSSLAIPFCKPLPVDALYSASPLEMQRISHAGTDIAALLFGNVSGATGETCALLLLIAGGFLAARRVINWRIPASLLGSAFAVSLLYHILDSAQYPSPIVALLTDGLLLGALFLATDPVGAPLSARGRWIFGGLIGALAVIVRLEGIASESIMYAILLGNATTPLIDRWTQPRVFGHGGRRHD